MSKPFETEETKKNKEEETLKKKYENPGQWLGNLHPITRKDK